MVRLKNLKEQFVRTTGGAVRVAPAGEEIAWVFTSAGRETNLYLVDSAIAVLSECPNSAWDLGVVVALEEHAWVGNLSQGRGTEMGWTPCPWGLLYEENQVGTPGWMRSPLSDARVHGLLAHADVEGLVGEAHGIMGAAFVPDQPIPDALLVSGLLSSQQFHEVAVSVLDLQLVNLHTQLQRECKPGGVNESVLEHCLANGDDAAHLALLKFPRLRRNHIAAIAERGASEAIRRLAQWVNGSQEARDGLP